MQLGTLILFWLYSTRRLAAAAINIAKVLYVVSYFFKVLDFLFAFYFMIIKKMGERVIVGTNKRITV